MDMDMDMAIHPAMLHRDQLTAITTARHRTEATKDREQLLSILNPPASSPPHNTTTNRRRTGETTPEPSDNSEHGADLVNNQCNAPSTQTDSDSANEKRNNRRNNRNYYPKFGEVFACIYFLGLMHSSWAAPSRLPSSTIMDTEPMWIDPCGVGTATAMNDEPLQPDDVKQNDKELFYPIEVGAKTALGLADQLKRQYVKDTFNSEFEIHNQKWSHVKYDWLPRFPKQLGGDLSSDYLDNLQNNMDTSMADIYEELQKIAVGMEQVDYDHMTRETPHQKMFNKSKHFLKEVLCEIHSLMNYRRYARKADITRDIMEDKFRNLDNNSDRNLRDWIVFREYMNAMEYVAQVFNYFGSSLQ